MFGERHGRFRIFRNGSAAVALVLSIASSVAAQSITDARRVEFTPSPDHNTIDPTAGIPLVNNYTLDVFLAGGTVVVATANLGKPAPDTDGMIRLDFISLLDTPLTPGVVYEALVSASGPGGATPAGARSNTFGFSLPCPPLVSPINASLVNSGGGVTATITASAGCAWTTVSNAAWIAVASGATGLGSGTATLTVASNTGTTSRTGTVTIGSTTVTINQAGTSCAFTLSPTSQTFTAAGGSSTVNVITTASCAWTATSGSSWVTISNGTGRTGSGSVGITATANSTTQSRTATLTIAGRSFVVTEPASTCSYTVTPTTVNVSTSGATGTISVTTLSTCAWSSSSTTSWISLTGSRTGSGSATYTIGANSGTTTRTATVTVAGVSVRFSQGPLTTPTAPTNLRIVK